MTPRSEADVLHCSSALAMLQSLSEAHSSGVTELKRKEKVVCIQ